MALKQLMLTKKIEQRKAALNELLEKENELQTRSAELEKAIEEAQTMRKFRLLNKKSRN